MDNKFSKSWINMRMGYDHDARSDILLKYLRKNENNSDLELIDLCCGSGSFLIWSIKNNLLFKKSILVDYDIKLLKSIKSNLRRYTPNNYTIKSNSNNMNLVLEKDKSFISSTFIKKSNCNKFHYKTKKFHIISYSAVLDLMSKSSIIEALNRANNMNVIYFSLCFNGIVKWTPTNTFDKYILSFFNNHQRSDKGFGHALGSQSIEFVRKRATKQNMKIITKNSPWIIFNNSQKDKNFMIRYLLDVKKALFHMEGVDRDILRKWYKDKKYDVENKAIKLYIGHQDLLLYKK